MGHVTIKKNHNGRYHADAQVPNACNIGQFLKGRQ